MDLNKKNCEIVLQSKRLENFSWAEKSGIVPRLI